MLGCLMAARAGAQPRSARIGYLATTDPKRTPGLDAFRTGLRELGWVEGKNLTIEYRWAEGEFDLKNDLAAELVRMKPDLIFTWGSTATAAAKRATSTIPIVFTWVGDPVGAGFVASLARPGGNLTGMSNAVRDVSAKNVGLMVDAVPGLRRLALVRNPINPNARLLLDEAEAAVRGRGIEHRLYDVRAARDFEPAFEAMKKDGVGAIVFLGDPMILGRRHELAQLSLKHRLPSIYNNTEYARAGGLMSYGADPNEVFYRTAGYVDKVLRGAKPADLVVSQPTNMAMIVNLRTAKALGITLSPSLLVRANQIIE